jgi:hypothetical protein
MDWYVQENWVGFGHCKNCAIIARLYAPPFQEGRLKSGTQFFELHRYLIAWFRGKNTGGIQFIFRFLKCLHQPSDRL